MEAKNRNVLIVVIVALVVACCCVLAAASAAGGWFALRAERLDAFDLGGLYQERVERIFEAGDAPELDITNFAGAVTVRAGDSETIRVVALKKASSRRRLNQLEVDMSEQGDRLVVRTKKLFSTGNASVELEITTPASTRLDVDVGAGAIDVRDVTGPIEVHSGAGTLAVRGASGPVRLALGAGEISYDGSPTGDCSFETGVGSISLRLPPASNVRVDLGTGLGTVSAAFPVDGRVTLREITGLIGDGSQGSIYAHTGAGNVILSQR